MLGRMDAKTAARYGERRVVLRGTSPGANGKVLARTATGKPLNNLELVERLCAISAALAAARRTHIQVFGSLMPDVFMRDVVARVRACMTAETTRERVDTRREVEAILAVLDAACASADKETRRVVAASFVREAKREAFYVSLRPLMSHKLQALLQPK